MCSAVRRGDLAALAVSLAEGARPAVANWSSLSALHLAVRFRDAGVAVAMARALMAGGASVHARSSTGRTPLHWAAAFGNAACCEALLLAGASADAVDVAGNTPLHETARRSGAMDCAAHLLAAGADVGRRNLHGNTAPQLASSRRRYELASFMREPRWAGLRRAALTAWCWRWQR